MSTRSHAVAPPGRRRRPARSPRFGRRTVGVSRGAAPRTVPIHRQRPNTYIHLESRRVRVGVLRHLQHLVRIGHHGGVADSSGQLIHTTRPSSSAATRRAPAPAAGWPSATRAAPPPAAARARRRARGHDAYRHQANRRCDPRGTAPGRAANNPGPTADPRRSTARPPPMRGASSRNGLRHKAIAVSDSASATSHSAASTAAPALATAAAKTVRSTSSGPVSR
jgi:hypothetical protein